MACPSCGRTPLPYLRALRTVRIPFACAACGVLLERGDVPWHRGLVAMLPISFAAGFGLVALDAVPADASWATAAIVGGSVAYVAFAWAWISWHRSRLPFRAAPPQEIEDAPRHGRERAIVAALFLLLVATVVLMPKPPSKPEEVQVEVVAAKGDVAAGTGLSLDCVAKMTVPEASLPASAVRASQIQEVLGQVLRSARRNGEAIRWSDCARAVDPASAGIVEIAPLDPSKEKAPSRPAPRFEAAAADLDTARATCRVLHPMLVRGCAFLGDLAPACIRIRRAARTLGENSGVPEAEWREAAQDATRLERAVERIELGLTHEFWRCFRLARYPAAMECLHALLRIFPPVPQSSRDKHHQYLILLERFLTVTETRVPVPDLPARAAALTAATHLLPGEILHRSDVGGATAANPPGSTTVPPGARLGIDIDRVIGARLLAEKHPGDVLHRADLELPPDAEPTKSEAGK